MQCTQCGNELRPGARFCNVCGAGQSPMDEAANSEQAPDADAGSSARAKRPARVPRPTLVPPLESETGAGDGAGDGVGDGVGDAETIAKETAAVAVGVSTPLALEDVETESLAPAPDWENVETAEYAAVVQPLSLPPAITPLPVESPSTSAPAWNPGGFSWPLPLQIIKGGRYRVEQVIQSTDDPATGENVYRVRDLQGYERCWSCGAELGAEHASESFCSVCGADLYGRKLRMYERQAVADASTAAPEASEADADADDADAAGDDAAGETDAPEVHTFVEGGRAYRVVPDEAEPSPFPMGPRLLIGMGADVGKTRPGEQNEDSIGVLTLTTGIDSRMAPLALLVVADGMGGHASGQEASRLVVRTLTEYVVRQLALPFLVGEVASDEPDEVLKGLLYEAARAANVALCQANAEQGMDSGCTLVAALIVDHTAYFVNVGDSRGYALADGTLRRITTDHSLVEQLISSGIVQPEERYTHPQRNKIYKSLGDDPALQPDIFVQRLQPGMRLLLCCDGVWEMIRDDELAQLLTDAPDPQHAAETLVARANENGGEDNISAIVLEARA